MKTLKNIVIGAALFVMCGLMLMFAVLAWIAKYIYAGFAAITFKIVNDALDLVNNHYLDGKDEDSHVKLLK